MMDGFIQTVGEWRDVLGPYPWARALVVMVAFTILASLLDRLITGIVKRAVAKTETHVDDDFLRILHRPLFTTVMLLGLYLAAFEFELRAQYLLMTAAVIKTVLIVIWVLFGFRASRLVLRAMRGWEGRFEFVQQSTEPLFRNALTVLLFVAGVYGILIAWDADVTGLVASAGIIGLALSFAAQDTLANLFAGVAILADRPYQIGEYIILDSGERGEVTHIGLRSTRLLTRDDVEVSIPNGIMGAAKIGVHPQRHHGCGQDRE
jgi:small-conductance mechanosensitive channel